MEGSGEHGGDGLERGQPAPLYHQVYLALAENIRSGRWKPGDLIPTEREICASFGVSRITARHALDRLVGEGAIERRRGSGSRVRARTGMRARSDDLDTLLRRVVEFGARTTGTVHECALADPPPEVEVALRLPAGALAHHSVQTRMLDGKPIGVIAAWAPADLAPALDRAALARAPIITLLERAGVRLGWTEQALTAVRAEPPVAERVGIEAGAPMLRLMRTVYDGSDRPVALIDALYRADCYEFRVRLGRPDRDRPG